jgi:hypothetical protein
MLNNLFHCDACGAKLMLPATLVNDLEDILKTIILTMVFKFNDMVIYRPKLSEVIAALPEDFKEVIELERDEFGDVIDGAPVVEYSSYFVSVYLRLLKYWDSVEAREEQIAKDKNELTEAALQPDNPLMGETVAQPTTSYLRNLRKAFVTASLTWDLLSDYELFLDVVIRYMDSFGCFALTSTSKAMYRYCEVQGINKRCFTDEETLEFLRKNAWGLAALRPIKSAASVGPKLCSLYIRELFVPELNAIFMLRSLSKCEELVVGTDYAKWLQNPEFRGTKQDKNIGKAVVRHKAAILNSIPNTRREAVKAYDQTFSKHVWGSAHAFYSEMPQSVVSSLSLMTSERAHHAEILKTTPEEYYGEGFKGYDSGVLLTETFKFEVLREAFLSKGGYPFNSRISDTSILDKCKVLYCLALEGSIEWVFKPTNILHGFEFGNVHDGREDDEFFVDVLLLAEDILHEGLLEMRDTMSQEEYLATARANPHYFEEDVRLLEKFGEVVRCLL